MQNLKKGLEILAHDAIGGVKKRRQISNFLKKRNFLSLGKGGWLGFRNDDVISGLLIEGSPLDTYISSFILPSFDRHNFINWSLGDRIVNCQSNNETRDECELAVDFYTSNVLKIRSSIELIEYLDLRQAYDHYSIWVRYICYLRDGRLNLAATYLNDDLISHMHPVQLKKFEEIRSYVAANDRAGVSQVLESWRAFSDAIFGPTYEIFSAL